jgi:glucose-1-phosphate cytidylyltransferase
MDTVVKAMKAIILAGGQGSRLMEETEKRPKPMVEVGGNPILWHIMRHYAAHGVTDFVICLGYLGYMVKEYFANYYLHRSDVTFDLGKNEMQVHRQAAEPWRVTLVDTGEGTQTGGRIKRVMDYIDDDDFCLTYGDGLSDLDITDTIRFHREGGHSATMTAVQPPGRFGGLQLAGDNVTCFNEKLPGDGGWINGGFFVLKKSVSEHLINDSTVWERAPLETLAAKGELKAFRHTGFWHPMDTLRDKRYLDELWSTGQAPWRTDT